MKLLIVNNLVSGYGEGAIYDYIRALAADVDVVVASGGDGTVAAVTYLLADTGIPVLPFPAGTANLLAMNLASPSEPHALAKLTREGEIMDFDLGEIELASGERFGFSIMAGAGYDALIMQGAKPAKRLLGPMAYFTSALTNPLPQFSRFTIDIDGEVIESEGVGVLIVNFSKIQFDLPVVHQNLPRDGVFDVAILHTRDAFGLIPALLASMLDRTGDFPDRTDALELHRGRTIAVSADPPLQVQYDGEVTELTTPFTVRMLPEAARFIVSEECVRLYGPDPEGPAA